MEEFTTVSDRIEKVLTTPVVSAVRNMDLIVTAEGVDFKNIVGNVQRILICEAMKIAGGNKVKASKLLRIKRTTMVEKMKKLGMPL